MKNEEIVAPSPAHVPKTERRLPSPHHMRLLLVVMVVVVLVALVGGYIVFRAATPSSRQASSAFQETQTVFYRLVTDLNSQPITFQTTNPQTGNSSSVEFTGNDLMSWLFNALYTTALIPQLPGVLFQIRRQDYTKLSQIYGSSSNTTSWGMHYSVVCGEDMAYTTRQHLQASVQVLAPELRPGMLASLQRAYRVCQL